MFKRVSDINAKNKLTVTSYFRRTSKPSTPAQSSAFTWSTSTSIPPTAAGAGPEANQPTSWSCRCYCCSLGCLSCWEKENAGSGYRHQSRARDLADGEVCDSRLLAWNLHGNPDSMAQQHMGSETSLGNGPVFTVCQKPETLNHTDNSLQ